MSSRLCVIFNPVASGEKARRFREHLGALSAQCTLKPTLAAGAGRALAAEAVREGFDTIVAAGGDGTVNEVINGMGDEPGGLSRTRFGVLPLGTVNVFARELKLPRHFHRAWEILHEGKEIQIDLAVADFSRHGQPERRYFIQIAGAGFDSRAIELVDWELKKKLGALAYLYAGLKALRGPLPPITVCNGQKTLAGGLVMIGNGRFYGGNFPVFPLADLQDGLLEVTVFPRVHVGAILRAGCGLLCNRIYTVGGARHFQAKQLTLSCADPIPFHVEGENAGHLPVTFSIHPERLRVLVPA